ncbi:MAG: T9SS type A sorting domain-containing protein [Bacteroidetes bacterium]|nr:T9SS type A sorting domain-containing protein [Bacteroidota bacterium]MBK8680960.1 T9SS type A sorting domain-containing protein [Bacteroidota bacterium]
MKSLYLTLLFLAAISLAQAQVQCDNDSTGNIPLTDLGAGTYLGEQGGLYPGGQNTMPSSHLKAGRKMARSIVPLDSLGNEDWVNGKVLFIGMGASTAGNTWNHFMEIFDTLSNVNPYLTLNNACLGAKGIEMMIDTTYNNWYWDDEIIPKLASKNSSQAQVQVVWIKTASKVDTIMEFPLHPSAIADKYEILMGVLQAKFPNLKLVFITSSVYGGYADPIKTFYDVVSEPGSYWNGFGVKWAIERQILGDPDLKYKGGSKKAPFMGWGPYVWADGVNPSSKGLYWNCEEDFADDGGGYHLTNGGKNKESNLLRDWALTDPIAKIFFVDGPKWNPVLREGSNASQSSIANNNILQQGLEIYPSPNHGNFYLQFALPVDGYSQLSIVNNLNQTVWEKRIDNAIASNGIAIDISGMPTGLYVAVVTINGQLFSTKFLLN